MKTKIKVNYNLFIIIFFIILIIFFNTKIILCEEVDIIKDKIKEILSEYMRSEELFEIYGKGSKADGTSNKTLTNTFYLINFVNDEGRDLFLDKFIANLDLTKYSDLLGEEINFEIFKEELYLDFKIFIDNEMFYHIFNPTKWYLYPFLKSFFLLKYFKEITKILIIQERIKSYTLKRKNNTLDSLEEIIEIIKKIIGRD